MGSHTSSLSPGIDVVLADAEPEALDRARSKIEKNLSRQLSKNRIDAAEARAALERVRTETELDALAAAPLVVEAVPENRELKLEIFGRLDELCEPDAVLASNTSSISITEIAGSVSRPARFIGMHFMNPVPMMQLVEVIRGLETDDETTELTLSICQRVGKTPVEVNDFPGFVSNRILMPMINEAVYCLMEGVAQPEAIDTVMKLGMNHPMGPLALADLIGPGHVLVHHAGAPQGPGGREVPAVPASLQVRGRGPPRPKDRPGLLRLQRCVDLTQEPG